MTQLEAMHEQIEQVCGCALDHIHADILHRYIDEQQEKIDVLYEACAEFVKKVDSGEARSKRSYQQMKGALAKARGE